MPSELTSSIGRFGLIAAGGYAFGPIGAAVGALLGGFLFGGSGPDIEGPRLGDLDVSSSTYGGVIPLGFGVQKVAGTIIWATDIEEEKRKRTEGEGIFGWGGQDVTEYSYYGNFAVAFGEGPAVDVLRLWAGSKLIFDRRDPIAAMPEGWSSSPASLFTGNSKYKYKIHLGNEDQEPDGLIVRKVLEETGEADAVPAHCGLVYIVFDRLPLAEWNNRIPPINQNDARRLLLWRRSSLTRAWPGRVPDIVESAQLLFVAPRFRLRVPHSELSGRKSGASAIGLGRKLSRRYSAPENCQTAGPLTMAGDDSQDHSRTPISQNKHNLSWKDYITLVLSLAAFCLSGLSFYFTFIPIHRLIVTTSGPAVEIRSLPDNTVRIRASTDITFINTGNRPAVVERVRLMIINDPSITRDRYEFGRITREDCNRLGGTVSNWSFVTEDNVRSEPASFVIDPKEISARRVEFSTVKINMLGHSIRNYRFVSCLVFDLIDAGGKPHEEGAPFLSLPAAGGGWGPAGADSDPTVLLSTVF